MKKGMPVQMVRLVDERCNEDNQNISRWMGVSRVPRMGLDQGSGADPVPVCSSVISLYVLNKTFGEEEF